MKETLFTRLDVLSLTSTVLILVITVVKYSMQMILSYYVLFLLVYVVSQNIHKPNSKLADGGV